MRSRRREPRLPPGGPSAPDRWSAGGSASSSRIRSASSSWTISSCATRSAGRCSTAEMASARAETAEDAMTTTPDNASSNLPGKPPVVDLATWQAARDELLVREKAHTREGDAIAAARRRLPMVEVDGMVEVTGADGPVPFLDLFQGRDELVVYQHMWYDGAPPQGQCEGCTTTAWHVKDAVYLNARGVSYAVLTSGPWDEVARYVEFMGYTEPWY